MSDNLGRTAGSERFRGANDTAPEDRELTELTGIGDKTAEKLRDDGIESPQELGDAYRQNSRVVTERGKRVQSAARDALFEERESFTDPVSGAEVTEENRAAFEKLATRRVSNFGSVSVDAANPKVSPDDEVRKFIDPVRQGEFSTQVGGDASLLGFAADAAENLGVDSLSSGELQDINRAAETANKEVTLRKEGATNTTTPIGTTTVGDFYQAQAAHQQRGAKARRVDNRREAETTTDFDEWQSDPARHDFPGVDTPERAGEVFPEERTKRKRGGFGTSRRTNRDRDKAASAFDEFGSLNEEQRDRIFDVSAPAESPFNDAGLLGDGR